MALFVIERTTALPPAEAWRRLTTWERHTGTVPLTRVTVRTPPPTGPGTVVVARTGLGRLAFVDPMRITAWEPGRHCRLEKTGRIVTGWAEIEVRPAGLVGPDAADPATPDQAGTDGGSWVRWREDVRVWRLPRVLDGLTAFSGRLVFGRVLDTLLRD